MAQEGPQGPAVAQDCPLPRRAQLPGDGGQSLIHTAGGGGIALRPGGLEAVIPAPGRVELGVVPADHLEGEALPAAHVQLPQAGADAELPVRARQQPGGLLAAAQGAGVDRPGVQAPEAPAQLLPLAAACFGQGQVGAAAHAAGAHRLGLAVPDKIKDRHGSHLRMCRQSIFAVGPPRPGSAPAACPGRPGAAACPGPLGRCCPPRCPRWSG